MQVLGRASAGFTLVEAIISMMIISIAALAMASALGMAFSHSSDNLLHTKTMQLAQAYVDEIQARRYDELTPSGGAPPCSPATVACSLTLGVDGESRIAFDDVDDYHGVDDTPPRDSLAQPMPDFAGFRVQVAVSYASAAQVVAWQLDDVSDAKIITVTVTTPAGKSRDFPVVRGNY
jgi:MSHA pilin protein MshD